MNSGTVPVFTEVKCAKLLFSMFKDFVCMTETEYEPPFFSRVAPLIVSGAITPKAETKHHKFLSFRKDVRAVKDACRFANWTIKVQMR
jgi:hypothetical protein